MELVPAEGNQQQQWALHSPYTQRIARIFSEHLDDDATLLRAVAKILQQYTGERYVEEGFDSLDQKLADILDYYQLNAKELLPVPSYASELLDALCDLYSHTLDSLFGSIEERINSLRGAIVELLGLALIKPRYDLASDKCANSRRFLNPRSREKNLWEVDIAAISYMRRQLEGYECKLNALYFANKNLIDLAWIYQEAEREDYLAHVGVISFDNSQKVERRLRFLSADGCIQAYGLDVLTELQYSPFDT
jgi:hypothetical protein